MKYLLKRDTILATIAVFLVMGLLTLIPLNLHVLDPLKMALTDIHFNDLSFATLKTHRIWSFIVSTATTDIPVPTLSALRLNSSWRT